MSFSSKVKGELSLHFGNGRHCEFAGITSDVTSYTIRHSFAMTLKEQNVPIEMISELLGHKSIKTTQIYLRSFSLGKMTEVNSACFGGVYNYESQAG